MASVNCIKKKLWIFCLPAAWRQLGVCPSSCSSYLRSISSCSTTASAKHWSAAKHICSSRR
jgi:hypothetical protein